MLPPMRGRKTACCFMACTDLQLSYHKPGHSFKNKPRRLIFFCAFQSPDLRQPVSRQSPSLLPLYVSPSMVMSSN